MTTAEKNTARDKIKGTAISCFLFGCLGRGTSGLGGLGGLGGSCCRRGSWGGYCACRAFSFFFFHHFYLHHFYLGQAKDRALESKRTFIHKILYSLNAF